MSRFEKVYCVFYMVYMAVYIPCFMILVPRVEEKYVDMVFLIHGFGVLLGLLLAVIVFHDLYKRDFPKPNTKVTWMLLICLLGVPIFVYIFKHGFQRRNPIT